MLVLFKDGDDDDHKELEVLRKDKSTEEEDDDVTNKRSFFSLLASCQIYKQRKLFDNRRFDVNTFMKSISLLTNKNGEIQAKIWQKV